MEQYEVQTTRQAEAQLAEIVHYLSHELLEPGIASALLTALEKAMASLSTFPQRAMLVAEEPWSQQGVRKLLCKNFLIYFPSMQCTIRSRFWRSSTPAATS